MDAPGGDPETANRLLAAAMVDRPRVEEATVDRAVELLGSDEKRARVAAAWILGLAADAAPESVVPTVPRIAPLLADGRTRPDAERALAYLGRARPREVEAEIEALDGAEVRSSCREAIWGVGVPRTVVATPEEEPEADGRRYGEGMGGSVHWSWTGGAAATYDGRTSAAEQLGPPSETPVEPDSVDLPHDAYEAVATLHEGDVVEVVKAVYPTGTGGSDAATLVRFQLPPTEAFLEEFAYRIALWDSLADHDHVLPVVDWGTDPGAWLAVEHAVGSGVVGLAAAAGVDAATWTVARVADAICHAHERGVTHGGLTPAAVVPSELFVEPGAWPFPRVTDWGIADLLREHSPGRVLPARYAAPEHLAPDDFGDVDDSTDVFGFGVTAYEALAGRSPFSDRSGPVREAVLGGDWEPITEANPALPSGLDAVVAKCLAPRKTERYETVQAVRAEFRTAVGDVG